MYSKIIRKYKIHRICSLLIPKKALIKPSFNYLCKYLNKNTPYINIAEVTKELKRILFIFKLTDQKQKMLFLCTNKYFYKTLNDFNQNKKWKEISQNSYSLNKKQVSFVCLYSNSIKSKDIISFKDYKLMSIGFLDFENHPNITDYTMLLSYRNFANIYIMHLLLKNILKYGNQI